MPEKERTQNLAPSDRPFTYAVLDVRISAGLEQHHEMVGWHSLEQAPDGLVERRPLAELRQSRHNVRLCDTRARYPLASHRCKLTGFCQLTYTEAPRSRSRRHSRPVEARRL